jgi:DNA polymerase
MDDATRAKRAVLQQLQSWQRAGVRQLPTPRAPTASFAAALPNEPIASTSSGAITEEQPMPRTAARKPSAIAGLPVDSTMPAGERFVGDKTAALTILRQEVAGCTLCKELAATRTQTVFGVGNANARVAFFGEAPGADEDRTGEPFVGRAGQLLDKIIAACTWKREDVYILNTLKCRPPGNRNPAPEELANCRPYWVRQLEIIQPEFIVCLGTFAAQSVLSSQLSIGKLRKQFHDYHGAKVLCTYHPSYLLRNPAAKKDVWEDMQMLMREMGIPVPKKGA